MEKEKKMYLEAETTESPNHSTPPSNKSPRTSNAGHLTGADAIAATAAAPMFPLPLIAPRSAALPAHALQNLGVGERTSVG